MATLCGSESSVHHARNLFLTSSSGPPAGADITATDKLPRKKQDCYQLAVAVNRDETGLGTGKKRDGQ